MADVTFRVDKGDKIGLVGRNGAGKTTLTKTLAGETLPTGGKIDRPARSGTCRRILVRATPKTSHAPASSTRAASGRSCIGIQKATHGHGERRCCRRREGDEELRRPRRPSSTRSAAMRPRPRPRRIASNLSLPDRILDQPLSTLSGGQRRRIELARILFSAADTMILDEPTNHLDADSIVWLREFLKSLPGRRDRDQPRHRTGRRDRQPRLLPRRQPPAASTSTTWAGSTTSASAPPTRSAARRSASTPRRRPSALQTQAAKFGAKATKAAAAHQMVARAEKLLAGLDEVRAVDRVAKLRFPDPVACGRTPLMASNLSKSYGSLEIFTAVDLAIDRGSKVVILGFNGAGKTTLLRILAGVDKPDTGQLEPGHGLRIGYYAQEHETIDVKRTRAREHGVVVAEHHRDRSAPRARLVPVHRRRRGEARRSAVRRREDPPRARDDRGLRRERAAARRADQQPRPGVAVSRSWMPSPTTRAPWCWSATTRAPSRR